MEHGYRGPLFLIQGNELQEKIKINDKWLVVNGQWMKENIIKNKTFDFAVRIVRLNQYLCHKQEGVCFVETAFKKRNQRRGNGSRS